MKTIDYSYFIERYNAGEMNDDERKWFLKEIEGNEKLRIEINLRKSTDELLKNHDVISLRNKLSEIEKRRATLVPAGNSKKIAYMKYAAVIAGLVLIGSIVMFSGKKMSDDEIINRYYKAYNLSTNQRSGLSETNTDFTLALGFYNTHDYENAAILFNKVIGSNPKDMRSTLLYGIANFENKKYPEAKRSFGNVIADNDNLFIDQAEWYLALCYIKTNESVKAFQQLEAIIKENGIYKDDAKKIIKKLK